MKKTILTALILFMVTSTNFSVDSIESNYFDTIATSENILYVGGSGPGNYSSIQDAINASNNGDKVFVYNGEYNESLWVNKSIKLTGENKDQTILRNEIGRVIEILADNVELSNFCITESGSGSIEVIHVNSDNNMIVNNNIINNNYSISSNAVTGIVIGSTTFNSEANVIKNNYINNNGKGIRICHGSNNTVINNTIANSQEYGIYVLGPGCKNTFIGGNTFDKNLNRALGPSASANIVLNNCIKIVIKGNNINNTCSDGETYGIFLTNSDNNYITGNNFTNNIGLYSINIESSNLNHISGNVFTKNANCLLLQSGNENIVHGNIMDDNLGIGIQIEEGYHTVARNSIKKCMYGILVRSDENNISGNFIDGCSETGVELSWCINNSVFENTISNNNYGLEIWSSHSNQIYHNNFINNKINAYATKANPDDEFDNTWYADEKGNYWSDYTGLDLDDDLIGDTPYDIPNGEENQDYYPLMVTYPFNEEETEDNEPPVLKITKPKRALYIFNHKIRNYLLHKTLTIGDIEIQVEASNNESGVAHVEFYVDNDLKCNDTTKTYSYVWKREKGFLFKHLHTIKIIAYDNAGNKISKNMTIRRYL
jgi:parallel beta-helix repeat protein